MNIKKLDLRFNSNLDYDHAILYDAIAENIRQGFINHIGILSKKFKSNMDWWVASPSSRNPDISPLFHYCCAFRLLQELIDKRNTVIEEIIVDSLAFRDTLLKYLINKRLTTCVSVHQPKHKLAKKIVNIIYVLIRLLIPFLYMRSLHFRRKTIHSNVPLTLIDTFVIPGFERIDRYYTGLWEDLNSLERETVYFVPTLAGFSLMQILPAYKQLLKSRKNYLIKEDYLKLNDYLYAFNHVLRVRRLRVPRVIFGDVDFSDLIQEEIYDMRSIGSSFVALLNYRFFLRLKQNKISILHTINWFENQIVDKGWNAGVRTFYPRSESTGYLGFTNLCYSFISVFPTKYEESAKVLPKNIAVIGQGFSAIIRKYMPSLNVEVAPALRFRSIWEKREQFPHPSRFTVMIALDGEKIEYDIDCL